MVPGSLLVANLVRVHRCSLNVRLVSLDVFSTCSQRGFDSFHFDMLPTVFLLLISDQLRSADC